MEMRVSIHFNHFSKLTFGVFSNLDIMYICSKKKKRDDLKKKKDDFAYC